MRIALRPYDQLLKALSPEIRPQVAHDNFAQPFKDMGPKTRRRRLGRKRNHSSFQLRILRQSPRPPQLMEERLSPAAFQ